MFSRKFVKVALMLSLLTGGIALTACVKVQESDAPATIVAPTQVEEQESYQPDVTEPIAVSPSDVIEDEYDTPEERDQAVYSEYLKAGDNQLVMLDQWYGFVNPDDVSALKDALIAYFDEQGWDSSLKVYSSVLVESSDDGAKTSYAWVYPHGSFDDEFAEVLSITYTPDADSSKFVVGASSKSLDDVRALATNLGAINQPDDGIHVCDVDESLLGN